MLNSLARIVLTATAIAPVGFTYSWVAYMQDQPTTALVCLIASLSLFVLAICLIRYAQSNLEKIYFLPVEAEPSDQENIGFMLLYLLPLFTDKIESLNWTLWLPTLVIFSIITARGYSYHFNPLLGLLGWHFYKVKSKEGVSLVLITKKKLRSTTNCLIVGELTEYVLLDVE